MSDIVALEDDLRWMYRDKNGNYECVYICVGSHTNDEECVVLLDNAQFYIEDVPKLVKALNKAYKYHMKNKETE